MKLEIVKFEEPEPLWRILERQMAECPDGHVVAVSEVAHGQLAGMVTSINRHSKLVSIASFRHQGRTYVKVVRRRTGAKPARVAPPEPQKAKDPFTVTSLSGLYVDDLSALANKHGVVRVAKSLFTRRGAKAQSYALMELRRRGHPVSGLAHIRLPYIDIPRAGNGRVIIRHDLKGKLNGCVLRRMEELTRPDSVKPITSPPAQVSVLPPPTNGHKNGNGTTKINLTKPTTFPTGNKCFICVGNGQSVCGEDSVTTYKGVKICRLHGNLLRSGARLYARPSRTRGTILLTKGGS